MTKVRNALVIALTSTTLLGACVASSPSAPEPSPAESVTSQSAPSPTEEAPFPWRHLPEHTFTEVPADQRQFFDATTHDIAMSYFKTLLTFDLAQDTRESIEAKSGEYFVDGLILPAGQLPYPWAGEEAWDDLVKDSATFEFTNIAEEPDGYPDNDPYERMIKFDVRFTITRSGHDPEEAQAFYFLTFDRAGTMAWQISDVGQQ